MNQRNIFSAIAILLLIQGVAFFLMKDTMITNTFPDLDGAGHTATVRLIEVMCALSILIGLVTWAVRSTPGVAWAYTLGNLLLVLVTSKHMFMDHINVPLAAYGIQFLSFLGCAYVWMKERSSKPAMTAV